MNQLNQIILEGIAVDNAVTVEIPSLKILFTVETSRTYKGTDGTVKEVSYFDVEYYGFNVKDLVSEITKGRTIRIVGRLKQNCWSDSNGEHSKVSVIAEHLELKPITKVD